MRRQPASSGLRALLYMDEVHGIIPPYPKNPPTKGPLLTLYKQGRAYGVGAWVATQNPVDLDYKALGNAGVKMVGRLITERDRERALEGLGMSELEDGRDADEVVASLGKRQFLLTDVRAKKRVRTFSSRWAMSYLRGPVTLNEMGPLLRTPDETGDEPSDRPGPTTSRDSRPHAPLLAVSAPVAYAADGGGMAAPSILVRNRLAVQRTTLNLYREVEEVWRIPARADGRLHWEGAEQLEEMPEIVDDPPEGMVFPKAAPGLLSDEVASAQGDFSSWRARRPLELLVNQKLKMAAKDGEDVDAFLERCLEVREVEMAVDIFLCRSGEPHGVDDAVVVELVADHGRFTGDE